MSGTQIGVQGRLRFARFESRNVAQSLDVVGAFSTGPYQESEAFPGCADSSGCWRLQAYWLQVSWDYELIVSNFHFAAGIGFAGVIAESDVQWPVAYVTTPPVQSLPIIATTHVTLGIAFP